MGQQKYHIQLSGFTSPKKSELSNKIVALGGSVSALETFDEKSTHIVCGKPSRSEKFLGGLATGKWLLTVDFVNASHQLGCWLAEEDFEWNLTKAHLVAKPGMQDVLASTERWRHHVINTGTKAFFGWRAAVLVENPEKRRIYKRLLQYGGAALVDIRLPIKRPRLVARDVSYVFVETDKDVRGLMQNGVLCVLPIYIAVYLVTDPPPLPREYMVGEPLQSAMSSLRQQSADVGAQQSIPQRNCTSTQHESLQEINAVLPVCSAEEAVVKTLPPGKESRSTGCPHQQDEEKVMTPPLTLPLGESPLKAIHFNKSAVDVIGTTSHKRNCGQTSETNPVGEKEKPVSSKRTHGALKRNHQTAGTSAMSSKRRRIELPWKPACPNMVVYSLPCSEQVRRAPLSTVLTGLFEVSFDEGHYMSALSMMSSSMSSFYHPDAKSLHSLVNIVLPKCQSRWQAYQVYNMLRSMLSLHPPTSASLEQVYFTALRHSYDRHRNIPGEQWQYIMHIIRCALGLEELSELEQENYRLLLAFVVAVMETNFACFYTRSIEGIESERAAMTTLWGQVVWPDCHGSHVNTACRQLMALISTALTTPDNHTKKMEILPLLQSLLAMSAHCCRSGEPDNSTLVFSAGMQTLICELAFQVKGSILDSLDCLTALFNTIPVPWLSMQLANTLLGLYDDSLVAPDLESNPPLTLTRIVSTHFFLLPPVGDILSASPHPKRLQGSQNLNGNAAQISAGSPITPAMPKMILSQSGANVIQQRNKMMTRKQKSSGNCKLQKSTCSPEFNASMQRKAASINKKNVKGETSLHRACIKNDVARVRELLKVPGVDVNTVDNAGWTPLHEVSNLGNIECLLELLKYRPPKTIVSYFQTGVPQRKALVLAVKNPEGVTPLHDAVMNNQLDAARLLLKHGGHQLLEAKTLNGQRPEDLVQTDAMLDILTSLPTASQLMTLSTPKNRRWKQPSDSQDSASSLGSQEDQMSAIYQPTEEAYREVIGRDKQFTISVLSCQIYARLVVYLVQGYLQTRTKLGPRTEPDKHQRVTNDMNTSNTDDYILRHWNDHVLKFKAHLQRILGTESGGPGFDMLHQAILSLQLMATF